MFPTSLATDVDSVQLAPHTSRLAAARSRIRGAPVAPAPRSARSQTQPGARLDRFGYSGTLTSRQRARRARALWAWQLTGQRRR